MVIQYMYYGISIKVGTAGLHIPKPGIQGAMPLSGIALNQLELRSKHTIAARCINYKSTGKETRIPIRQLNFNSQSAIIFQYHSSSNRFVEDLNSPRESMLKQKGVENLSLNVEAIPTKRSWRRVLSNRVSQNFGTSLDWQCPSHSFTTDKTNCINLR